MLNFQSSYIHWLKAWMRACVRIGSSMKLTFVRPSTCTSLTTPAYSDGRYKTIAWIAANPDEARTIMAEKAGVSVKEYASFEAGTTIFTPADALNAFDDRAGDPTSLPEMARRINPFLVSSGLSKQEAAIDALFD